MDEIEPAATDAEVVAVPSGQVVTFLDAIRDTQGPDGLTMRFRFVAPAIAAQGGTVDLDTALADMQALCETYALPRVTGTVPEPRQIVIALADRALPFGEAAPDATQYFEGYRVENGICIWEAF